MAWASPAWPTGDSPSAHDSWPDSRSPLPYALLHGTTTVPSSCQPCAHSLYRRPLYNTSTAFCQHMPPYGLCRCRCPAADPPGVAVPAVDGGAVPAGPAARRAAVECEQPGDGPRAGQAGGAGGPAVLQEQAGRTPVAGEPDTTSHARGECCCCCYSWLYSTAVDTGYPLPTKFKAVKLWCWGMPAPCHPRAQSVDLLNSKCPVPLTSMHATIAGCVGVPCAPCRTPTRAAAATALPPVQPCKLCWRAGALTAASWSRRSGSSWQVIQLGLCRCRVKSCASALLCVPCHAMAVVVLMCSVANRLWLGCAGASPDSKRHLSCSWAWLQLVRAAEGASCGVFVFLFAGGVTAASGVWGRKWLQLLDWEESGGRARRSEVWALTGRG